MRLRHLLPALALCGAPFTAARAQQFIGTVVQPDGQTPTAGVLVVATDSAGRTVAQAVSGTEGRFTLFVDSAVALTLRLYRTGYAPTVAATRRVGQDEIVDLVAVLGAERIVVPALRRGTTTCGRADATQRAAVELVLEEVRKAFLAAQATIGRPDLQARYATFEHRVAKTGEDTLRSVLRRAAGPLPSLFRATTPEELEGDGFFVTAGGERVFRAPEPALLASPWFTRTHCFTLQPQGDTALRVAFRPTRERRGIVELEGAYVLDPRTLAPRRVEFAYIGLREEERFSAPQGALELAQVAGGDWVTTRWWQRFPLLGYRTSDGATTLVRTSMTLVDVIGHRIQGGRVLAVLAADAPLFRADPVEGAPAAGEFGRACPERLVRQSTGAARGVLPPADSVAARGLLVRASWGEPVVVDRTEFTTREQVRETFTDDRGAWLLCDIPPRRDATLRWEARGQERSVPFTLAAPGTVLTVAVPPAP